MSCIFNKLIENCWHEAPSSNIYNQYISTGRPCEGLSADVRKLPKKKNASRNNFYRTKLRLSSSVYSVIGETTLMSHVTEKKKKAVVNDAWSMLDKVTVINDNREHQIIILYNLTKEKWIFGMKNVPIIILT